MATQKYTTLGQGSLSTSYTAGATTITVGTGQGATFPSAGDFVVALNDPPSFFLKCTARAGDVLTVATSAVDGTVAANMASGTAVTEVITASVLDGIRGDMHQTGAFSSRPTAEKAGNLYLPSDGFALHRDTGAAYASWGPLRPLVTPDDSAFSWVNQGSATVDTSHGGIILANPAEAGSDNLRLRVKSRPSSAPWTVTAAIIPNVFEVNFHLAGLCVRESGTGKISFLATSYPSTTGTIYTSTLRWSDTTTPTSWSTVGSIGFPRSTPFYIRVTDDGTNLVWSVSNDGYQFATVRSVGRTSYMTGAPDQVGYFVHCENTTYPVSMALLSWKES